MEAVMRKDWFSRRAVRPQRRRFTGALRLACVLVLASATLAACDDENKSEGGGGGGGRGNAKKPAKGAKGAAAAGKDTGHELAQIVYKDEDFVPSIRNRDPFQSYSVQFKAKAPDEMQRRVIMSTTAIEDMRLI